MLPPAVTRLTQSFLQHLCIFCVPISFEADRNAIKNCEINCEKILRFENVKSKDFTVSAELIADAFLLLEIDQN